MLCGHGLGTSRVEAVRKSWCELTVEIMSELEWKDE